MAEAPRQLLFGDRQGNAFSQVTIEDAHQPGPVCAGLAMHQHRILNALEQVAGPAQLTVARRGPGADLVVHQLDAVAAAGLFLQPVTAARVFTAQIDNGANTVPRHGPDVMRRGLSRSPCLITEAVPV